MVQVVYISTLVLVLLCASSLAQQKPNVTICMESYHDIPDELLIQMADYTGKAVDDMGNYDGCQELNASLIQYCVAQTEVGIGKNNEHLSVYMGLCAPKVCTSEMLREIIVKYVNESSRYLPSRYSLKDEIANLGIHCVPRGQQQLTWGAVVAIIVFSVIGLLVLGGTMLEYAEEQMAIQNANRMQINTPYGDEKERRPLMDGDDEDKRLSVVDEQDRHLPLPAPIAEGIVLKKRPNKLGEFLKCFGIKSNLAFLLKDNRSGEPNLSALNGLRCLMMFWIILGHTFTYLTTPVGFDNSILVTQKIIERVSFQVVSAAELAVDAFFYMSGFLVVYMVLKEMKKSKRKSFPWGLFYFHRYWRLTPVYAFIIFFYTTLTPFMIYGPFAYLYRGLKTDNCEKYWWANILYINNFYPSNSNDQCMGWGWYLANDMQFYIFSPLLILLYKKNKKAAGIVVVVLTLLCWFLDGFLTYIHKLRPLDPGDARWNSIVYVKPYTRMAPYLIGIGFAFLVQNEHVDYLRNWMVRWAMYILSAAGTTCSTYLTYGFWRGTGWETWQNVMYAAGARGVFVLGTAIFMYACFKGHGGVLRSMLSVYMWVPIARLTYTAYLTHPLIMFVINFSATTNFHYSAIYAGVRFSSHIFLAYVCGLIFHLAIEKPTSNVERIFLPVKKH